MIRVTTFLLIPFFIWFCRGASTSSSEHRVSLFDIAKKSHIAYDWSKPSHTITLPYALTEISGLDYTNGKLIAINDEKGIVYTLNPNDGSILKEDTFGKNGDYEGIAVIPQDIVVLKSNGDLFFMDDFNPTRVKTGLNKKNDLEGLTYDPHHNQLLLAAKGHSDITYAKVIYSFDLATNTIDSIPYLEIDRDDLWAFAKSNLDFTSKSKQKKAKRRIRDFAPSGIAMDRTTSDIYIVSARGSILVIIDAAKNIKNVVLMDEKRIPQPEGITFDESHNLYISTEGKSLLGKIYKYARK